ncbi:MAG TPA: hypothetical protein DDZ53_12665 [Firmicutes bacterium]|nr:hypothetical protein [Bacillota bacterium]
MLNKRQRFLTAVAIFCSLALCIAPLQVAGGGPLLQPSPRLEEVDLASYLREQQLAAARLREVTPTLPEARTTVTRATMHVVQKGDTLWSLAQQYSVSVAALKQWNSLRNNLIKVGQTLQVSAGQPLISRSGTSTSYQLLWPVIGTVSSGWGYRTRFEKFHYGLDIAAPTGTPIYAACAGVVEYAGWKNGYGYCVFLDHGNGLKTAYGHASKLYVKRGQSVEAGQRIAAVGSTGFSTGPHVHLEVRINGRLVNPATVLPKTR